MMHHHGGGPEIENDMVLIPGGEFIMGSTSAEVEETIKAFGKKETFNKEACRMESPQKKATIKPFYIDRYEVTNAEYRKFILATGHQPPSNWSGADYPIDKANFPAVMIAYKDTEAYAKWAGKRLPTEAEWEKAARGADGRIYPWGSNFEPGIAHTAEAVMLFGGPVNLFQRMKAPMVCMEWQGMWLSGHQTGLMLQRSRGLSKEAHGHSFRIRPDAPQGKVW